MTNSKKIVTKYFEAFKTGDIDGALALLDENVVWNVAGVPNVSTVGFLRGKERVREWMMSFPDNFQPLDFVIDKYFKDESDVLVTGYFRHRIISTGRVAGSDLVIRFTVVAGLISRYQIFEDSDILSKAFDSNVPWKSFKQRINGRVYAYDDTHDGIPLIFTHGLLVNRSIFADQIQSLSADHRCINMDMPGHGESETPDGPWTLEDVADDLALFITENHLGPVNFVGLSQGGMTGIRLAAKYPELVNKLILIGASARPEFPERLENWRSIRTSILEEGNRPLEKVFKGIQQNILTCDWMDKNPEKTHEERKMMLSNDRRGMALSIDTAVMNRTDVMGLLPEIKAETLVICGELDQATPLSLSEEIAEGIPNGHLHILPGAGHHAPIQAPIKFTEIINDFLKR